MNTIPQNLGNTPDLTIDKLYLASDRWYRSLKSIALLYRWGLIHSHDELIGLLHLHQSWMARQHYRRDDNLLNQLIGSWPVLDRQPRIWACLHIGPYAMVARALMMLGRKLAILLRADVFEEQGQIYRQQYKLSFGREATEAELIFIKADRGNPLLKLREALRKNYDVVVYIDGQLSIDKQGRGWATVKLHGTDLSLREGIVALSHWADTPIIALLLTEIGAQIRLRASEDLYVQCKADYPRIMQHVFDPVHLLKAEELLQWECLPTIFDKSPIDLPENKPDQVIWLPFLVADKGMLFDVTTCRSVGIGPKEFELARQKFREIGIVT
ncbi:MULTISPECIES: hypothetical protein [Sphingobacterium]|uniref:hypothetical protein n=1 Tax=Sphingobacterium TaxID=28453 RepID=UPI00257D9441|nr:MULTISPECIES: hypothetical protein [Sphingobacterium]